MEDVVEIWQAVPHHLKGTPGAEKTTQTRNISKLFLRGDGVILIVQNPNPN
jgi:small nuclear ribonucleoprotein (snRNP)-like protein